MSRLADAQSRGLAHHRAAQGSPTCNIGSLSSVPCVASTAKRGTVLEVGGFTAEIALTLIVRQSDIGGAAPVAGNTATFAGGTYRVLAVGKTAGGATYEFELGNPNR